MSARAGGQGPLAALKRVEAIRRLYFTVFGSYRRQWDAWARDEANAMHAIAPGTTGGTFEQSGVEVAERLRPHVRAADRVLEVGCGMGRIMRPVAAFCAEITGVDVSARMVSLAKAFLRDVPNARVLLTNGSDLRIFNEGSFDVAYVLYVLQHLEREHAVRYLDELRRVLAPGGTLVCEVPNLLFQRNVETYIATARKARTFSVARSRFYTPDELLAVLRGVGLTVVDTVVDSEIFAVARKP